LDVPLLAAISRRRERQLGQPPASFEHRIRDLLLPCIDGDAATGPAGQSS